MRRGKPRGVHDWGTGRCGEGVAGAHTRQCQGLEGITPTQPVPAPPLDAEMQTVYSRDSCGARLAWGLRVWGSVSRWRMSSALHPLI